MTTYVANTLAHELTHILGGEHISDQLITKRPYEAGNCACHHLEDEYCLMSSSPITMYIFT
ncbi:hypothetical protein HZS_4356 [Henneguya salminicola]|nr:hypothetical protein HZS_4356 [Henneguya salminicola]